ncbi:NmrA/HSCARG family protein [Rubrivirga marina]|uniref:Nucleoside-diphosphate sugar epimerase n=1 Tax=Rubrivirga marina TaxID=1196024 RepID=A0A271J1T2_9BACT|nr:NmrA/HSCARG family protein [Rubrivirga marina]PAP77267.1 nucleoside-diphosphate sugar epimerase [Rubrivirga marina]
MAPPILAVVGATGAQGGGLARAALADPARRFRVRAVTRRPESAPARELARLGAEVAAADLDDPASVRRAFEGADAAFCVTNFWEHFSGEREIVQAEPMAAAAEAAGVGHVVWSTLEDTRRWVPLDDGRMPTLQGRFKVPHFDAKGEADALFTGRGLPVTLFRTSFYWENLIGFGVEPRRGADGVLTLTLPMGDRPLPGIAAEDIGRCAYGVLRQPERYVGATVGVAGEHPTGAEMAAALAEALGEEVRYHAVPPDAYRVLGFPGADELGNMFQVKHDANDDFCSARSVEGSRLLNPDLQTFRQWLAANAARIPVEPPLATA